MEYAEGGSLHSLLVNRKKELSWYEKWKLSLEAATAVEYLHRRKILHRDLKSPNFLLVKGEIKLAGMQFRIKIEILFANFVNTIYRFWNVRKHSNIIQQIQCSC